MATVHILSAIEPPDSVEPGSALWDLWYYLITRATRGGHRFYVTEADLSWLRDEVYEARRRRRDISALLTDDLNPLLASMAVDALQREEIKGRIADELIARVTEGLNDGKENL